MAGKRYYTVWIGVEPGVYDRWEDCQPQVDGFPGARYKSFKTREEAVAAYRGDPGEQLDIMRAIVNHAATHRAATAAQLPPVRDYSHIPGVRTDAIATDGACSGNPGRMEYRAVRLSDGAEVFRVGDKTPLTGTNNIAEYLAIIHLAALLQKKGDTTTPIYTDSRNNFAWLKRGASKTTLQRTPKTAPVLDLLARADAWLAANGPIKNPILKWKTEEWGEIPADFGRK